MKNIAVILAGGVGNRMGNIDKPKQFLKIANKDIFIHTVSRFLFVKNIDAIVIASHKKWKNYVIEEIKNNFPGKIDKTIFVCEGGINRNKTILNSIDFSEKLLKTKDFNLITHDSVRPFVSYETIQKHVDLISKHEILDTVVTSDNTIVFSEDGKVITSIPERKKMLQGVTPQSFISSEFKKLYNKVEGDNFTDACGLFSHFGKKIHLIYGRKSNIKITTPYDLRLARAIVEIGNEDD